MASTIQAVEMVSLADSVEQRLLRCLSGQQTECDQYLHVITHLRFMVRQLEGRPNEKKFWMGAKGFWMTRKIMS